MVIIFHSFIHSLDFVDKINKNRMNRLILPECMHWTFCTNDIDIDFNAVVICDSYQVKTLTVDDVVVKIKYCLVVLLLFMTTNVECFNNYQANQTQDVVNPG